MKLSTLVTAFLTLAFLVSACKKDPASSDVGVPSVAGSYVGVGHPGGLERNCRLELQVSDSADLNEGVIRFAGQTSSLDSIVVNAGGDSVRFSYVRSGQRYGMRGVVSAHQIELDYDAPSPWQSFTLNRDDGRNLSGIWAGSMSSEYFQVNVPADMILDDGSNFDGLVSAYFFGTWEGDFTSATFSGNNFVMYGTSDFEGSSYHFQMAGSLVGADSISGIWEMGNPPVYDTGIFEFGRDF